MAHSKRDYWLVLDTLLLETVIFDAFGILRGRMPRWTALALLLINLSVIFFNGKVMLSSIDRDAYVAAQKRAKQHTLAMEEWGVLHAGQQPDRGADANNLQA